MPSRGRLPLLAALLLSACGAGQGPATGSATAPPAPAAPLLVQVENAAAARPQSGLQGADVVYEYLAEGGVSRFTAIYMRPPPGRVGPIRSARLATVRLQKLYAGVLAYAGAGSFVQQQVTEQGLPAVDEDTGRGDLFRIDTRSPPHNLYTDAHHAQDILAGAKAAPIGYSLWPRTQTPPPSAVAALHVSIPVSSSETPLFTWDAAAGAYTRTEPDTGLFLDADAQAPLHVPTLIAQQVAVTPAPEVVDVNGAIGVDHDLSSGGTAQVFTGGHEYDATWTQPATGPPQYTLAGGGAAPIAPGLVVICLIETGETATLG
jgi:hypothetical protein